MRSPVSELLPVLRMAPGCMARHGISACACGAMTWQGSAIKNDMCSLQDIFGLRPAACGQQVERVLTPAIRNNLVCAWICVLKERCPAYHASSVMFTVTEHEEGDHSVS
jgi:hypothetical protein